MEEGYCKGEVCNRESCQGIITERNSDGGCSCHINPPCSYCETSREYCPECDWDGREEQLETYEANKPNQAQIDAWAKQNKEWDDARTEFYRKFHTSEPVTEFNYRRESHSNSSMKMVGMYAVGSEIPMDKIIGTFGGRFEMNNKERGRFIYIAYTD